MPDLHEDRFPVDVVEEQWRERAADRMARSNVGREQGLNPVDCLLLLDEALFDGDDPHPWFRRPAGSTSTMDGGATS